MMDPELDLRLPVMDKYAYNEPIEVELDVIGNTSLLSHVEFYVGNKKLKTDETAPFRTVWLDSTTGTNLIWAKAYYVDGSVEASVTNQIVVLPAQSVGGNILPNGVLKTSQASWQALGRAR